MKKRLLSRAAALLTASLLALQLAGCGASSGGSAENATAQTTASYDQAAVEESGVMEIAAEAPTADSAAKVNYDTGGTLTDTLNQTTMPEDLELTGMNFGWEVPGTFDAGLQIRNLSIRIVE